MIADLGTDYRCSVMQRSDDAQDQMDVRAYVDVLRRRKAMIALCLIGAVVLALAISALQPSQYSAVAEILVRSSAPVDPLASTTQNVQNDQRNLANEVKLIRSSGARDAARATYQGSLDPADVGATIADADTDVIRVSVQARDPAEAATLVNTYVDSYIAFRRDQEVSDLLAAGAQIKQKADDLQVQIDEASKPLADLDGRISAAAAKDADALKTQRVQLAAQLQPVLSPLQSQLAFYQQQLDKVQVSAGLKQAGTIQKLTPAEPASTPDSPTPVRNAALAAVLGLLLGVGGAFLLEQLDDSVKSKDDLDQLPPGFGVLSLIPIVEGWKDRSTTNVVSITAPTSPAAEAYRALRTSLQFIGLEHPTRIIQVTSPQASEGKTTTLSNLAVALSRAGKRVIIVDCDLRRPRVESFFGVDNAVGFTTVLLGDADLESALQPVPDQPRLAILPAGHPPPNPSELLSTARARDVLTTLRSRADFVLVDSPPVLPVADAIILAGVADATLLVVLAGTTTKQQVRRAAELLSQVDAPMIGTVLNAVDESGGSGYSYGYGRGAYARPPDAGGRSWRGRRAAKDHAVRNGSSTEARADDRPGVKG